MTYKTQIEEGNRREAVLRSVCKSSPFYIPDSQHVFGSPVSLHLANFGSFIELRTRPYAGSPTQLLARQPWPETNEIEVLKQIVDAVIAKYGSPNVPTIL